MLKQTNKNKYFSCKEKQTNKNKKGSLICSIIYLLQYFCYVITEKTLYYLHYNRCKNRKYIRCNKCNKNQMSFIILNRDK